MEKKVLRVVEEEEDTRTPTSLTFLLGDKVEEEGQEEKRREKMLSSP